MAKKPGVMIYFETGAAIKGLDYEQKGRLFEAIMEYAEHGTVPPLDGILTAVWPFLANSIDRDAMSYEKTVTKRKRAAFAKWWPDYAREHGLDPNDKEAKERWLDMQMQANDANADFAMQNMPTPTTTPTRTTTPTPAPTGTPTRAPTTTADARLAYGRYGNVMLTDAEYAELDAEFYLFDNLLDKFSVYMKSTGKNYESHAATLRKWAMEDAEKEAEKKAKQTAQARRNSGNVFLDIVEGGALE